MDVKHRSILISALSVLAPVKVTTVKYTSTVGQVLAGGTKSELLLALTSKLMSATMFLKSIRVRWQETFASVKPFTLTPRYMIKLLVMSTVVPNVAVALSPGLGMVSMAF